MRVIGIILITMLASFSTLKAQSGSGVITMKSSIVCGMCKDTIEKGMAYKKGVKSTFVNVEENTITVHYKPKKITEKEIKQAINDLGYVAGDMKPSKEAYDKLHGCCKAGGVCD